jgi:hypothetical protein
MHDIYRYTPLYNYTRLNADGSVTVTPFVASFGGQVVKYAEAAAIGRAIPGKTMAVWTIDPSYRGGKRDWFVTEEVPRHATFIAGYVKAPIEKTVDACKAKFDNPCNFGGFPGKPKTNCVISVYLDDGRVFEYDVADPEAVREHTAAIVAAGYRRVVGDTLTHFPPHRIMKVKAQGPGISTNYPDRMRGT